MVGFGAFVRVTQDLAASPCSVTCVDRTWQPCMNPEKGPHQVLTLLVH